MKSKYLVIYMIILLLIVLAAGCSEKKEPPPQETPQVDDSGEIPDDDGNAGQLQSDDSLEAWVEYSRTAFMAQSREIDDMQYLLVTYGEKSSGGYAVEITNVDIQEDKVEVTVSFTEPAPGEEVTHGIEYPYALEQIQATGLPAVFIPMGAEEYIPQLIDVDYLPPVVAESNGIKVFSPAPGTLVTPQFFVEGVANVYEGNIEYSLLDENATVLVRGFTTAAMGDWKYFAIELVVDEAVTVENSLVLQLFTESAQDGQIQDLIEIPLVLDK